MEEKRIDIAKGEPGTPRSKSGALASARRQQKSPVVAIKDTQPGKEKVEKPARDLAVKAPRVGPIAAAGSYVRVLRPDPSESVVESSESLVESSESVVESSDSAERSVKLPRLPRAPASTLSVGRRENLFQPGRASPLTDRPRHASPTGSKPNSNPSSKPDRQPEMRAAEAELVVKKPKGDRFFKLPKRPRVPKLPSGFPKLKGFDFTKIGKKGKTGKDAVPETPAAALARQLESLPRTTRTELLTAKIAWKTIIAKNDAKSHALLISIRDALWASARKSLREENVEVFYALLAYADHKKNKGADLAPVLAGLARAFRQPRDEEQRAQINLTGKAWALLLGADADPAFGIAPFLEAWSDETNARKRQKLESILDAFAAMVAAELAVFMADIWTEFTEAVEGSLQVD